MDTADLEATDIKSLILLKYQNDNFELSHSDPIQEKLFEAELKTEIRKLLCKKLVSFLGSKNNIQTKTNDFQETSKYSMITVHLFYPDFRASELLLNCQRQRKNFIVTERKRAALFFRFQRLQDEVQEAKSFNDSLITQRKELEHKLFEIESQYGPLLTSRNVDIKQMEAQNDERIRLDTMINEALLEKEKFENERNLLEQELNEIRKRSENLHRKTGSLSFYQQKHENLNKSLQKISLLLGERHELLITQYQIQQKLKAIVSRRECAFNSFATSIQNNNVNANLSFHGESSLNELKSAVSKLKIHIREKREILLLNSK
uniref:DUF4201 domain-containing protein n=1 Tax=Panagrolaimus sp. ES5 TaxID=591445 RepID=A0AC34F052_9BILA